MKKCIHIIILFLLSYGLNAQTFTVGSTCCNYNNISTTFTTYCWTAPTGFSSSDKYSFDIDGDLIMDISAGSFCSFTPGTLSMYGTHKGIYVRSNNGVEFAYSLSGCSAFTSTPSKLNIGTNLNASLTWSTSPSTFTLNSSSEYIYYNFTSNSGPGGYSCGIQNSNYYVGFRKILPSIDTIYGWIRLDSNFPGKVYDYAYTCGSYTGTPVPSTITTAPAVVCKNDSILLSATPAGGTFYGTGVNGNYFKSKNLAAGVYTVNYAIPNLTGCATLPSSVVFTVISNAAITNTQTSLCVGESLTLTASPEGGVFTGVGVTGSVLSPTTTGQFSIRYDYSVSATCSRSTSVTFTVNACVGIDEFQNLDHLINIYPNPASTSISVELPEHYRNNNFEIRLLGIDGRKITSQRMASNKTAINLSEINQGIYIVEVVNENTVLRKKLIISR